MRQHLSPTVRLSPNTDRAVERLTQPHAVVADGHAVHWPPLIDWITSAITEQVKRGGASSGDGNAGINEGALRILNRMEQGVAALRGWLYLPARVGSLSEDLAEAWRTAHDYRAKNELNDEAWGRIVDRIALWVTDIEAEWEDRPNRMELTVPCPVCGSRWIEQAGADRHAPAKRRSAVVIEYSADRAPVAECRSENCGGLWVGWGAIAALGFTLGASQDIEVLRACGIELEGIALQITPQ